MPRRQVLKAVVAFVVGAATTSISPLARPLAAAEAAPIAWHRDVKAAWQSTQQQKRPLLVFVTTDHCMYCTKMKRATYDHPTVAATINRSFVPLVLDGESASPLLADLAVQGFPATFIISPGAVILDRLDGYVPPEKLMARLTAAMQPASSQPGASNR